MTTATTTPTTAPVSRLSTRGGAFTGMGTLVRLILRRDRVRIPLWVGGLTMYTVSSAATFPETYPTAADRATVATTMDLPATVAMLGPNYAGPDSYTYGAMTSHQMLVMTAVIVGLMSVLLLTRHTRTEEESGRAELVRATVVGRHAPTAAALTVIIGVNVVLGLLIAASLAGLGIESVTIEGSLLLGASLAAVGLVFAAVTAVTVQITEHARGASGMALAVLGAAYAVRAAGDVGAGTATWLSPIGWAQQTRAYIDDRWWPLLIALTVTTALIVVAFVLGTRRDVGAGLRPPRPGRATASDALAHPQGHALRLQRASLAGWCVAAMLLGVMYGSVLGGAEEMLSQLEAVREMIPDISGADIVDSFASMVLTVLAMICSVQAVLAVLRLRSEEASGRAEPVLATGISRPRWASTHLVVGIAGGTLVLLVAGLSFGVAGAIATGDGSLVWRGTGAALAYAPAVWVTAGIAMALFGLLPRLVAAVWAVVGYSFVVVYLGGFLQFPAWMSNLSPFGHVPRMPAAAFAGTPLFVLTLLAGVLITAGLVGFRRRDLRSPA